jgi:hypothetical protein
MTALLDLRAALSDLLGDYLGTYTLANGATTPAIAVRAIGEARKTGTTVSGMELIIERDPDTIQVQTQGQSPSVLEWTVWLVSWDESSLAAPAARLVAAFPNVEAEPVRVPEGSGPSNQIRVSLQIGQTLVVSGPPSGVTVTGTSSAALVILGSAAGFVGTVSIGTSSGTLITTGSAAGVVTVTAASSQSLAFGGSASGGVRVGGASSQTLAITGTAAGLVGAGASTTGSSSATLDLTGTAAGAVRVAGASSQVLAITGTAAGAVRVTGSTAQTLAITGTAAGVIGAVAIGNSSATLAITGTAAGTVRVAGASAQSLAITGTAVGTVRVTGSTSQAFAITGTAAGTVRVTGSTSQTLAITGTSAGYDLDQGLTAVGSAKVLLNAGHDEYWSDGMLNNTEAFIDGGGHAVSMSANTQFWRIRWADAGRTFWCYKDTMPGPTGLRTGGAGTALDPVSWTGTWRDTRWGSRRPENLLLAGTFRMNGIRDESMVINGAANQAKPFWRSTTVASGTTLTVSQVIGFEADSLDFPNAGGVNLGTTNINIDGAYADNDGQTYTNNGTLNWGIACHYPRSGGTSGLVFNFCTNQWLWGLSDYHRRGTAVNNREMRQATYNLFTDLGAAAVTKESDLTTVSAVALSTYGATKVNSGSSAQTLSITGTAAGTIRVTGASAQTFAITGSAAGAVRVTGASAQTLTITGTGERFAAASL